MVFAGAFQLRNVNNVIVLRPIYGIDLLGDGYRCKDEMCTWLLYRTEFVREIQVTRLHQEAALGKYDESSKQISEW